MYIHYTQKYFLNKQRLNSENQKKIQNFWFIVKKYMNSIRGYTL